MSEHQKNEAEKVIDRADEMMRQPQHNSFTVLQQGMYELNKLGLNTFDFAAYKRRLEKVAGVK